jgi:putative hemolysin
MRALPPLLKGSCGCAAPSASAAVVDHAFHTVDVCLVLLKASLKVRYQRHFAPSTGAVHCARPAPARCR